MASYGNFGYEQGRGISASAGAPYSLDYTTVFQDTWGAGVPLTTPPTPVVADVVYGGTANSVVGYWNITGQTGSASSNPALGTGYFGSGFIGKGPQYDPEYWAGDIGEVLIYNGALSDADRQAVESYSDSKWLGTGNGGGQVLPANTPVSIGSSGILDLGGNSQQVGALTGSGTVTNSGVFDATLTVAGAGQFNGVLRDGATNKLGLTVSGSLTLTGANAYSGNTVVSGGTLTFTNVNTFGGINGSGIPIGIVSIHQGAINVAPGGALTNTSEIDVGDTAGQTGMLTLSSGTASVSLASNYFSGVNVGYNGGTGVLTMTGNSFLTVTPTAPPPPYTNVVDIGFDSNNFTGSAGTVAVGGASTLCATGNAYISVGDGGTGVLVIANSGSVQTGSFVLGSTAQSSLSGGVGTLYLNGGTLSVPQVQNNAGATGNIYFNGGTLQAMAANTDFLQSTGGTLNAYVQAGGAVIDTDGNVVAINQSLAHDPALGAAPDGGLKKVGNGSLTLNGTSAYTGPTTISGGTLELGSGENLPPATALTIAASGVFDLAGNVQTVGSLSGPAGAVVANSLPNYPATLTVAPSSGSTTFAGNIIGNNALALSGSGELTLSGTNAYYGGTTVSGGTLDIAAPSALAGSGLVTIAAGGRLVLGSGAGIGALLAASSPVGSGAVALSAAASAPAVSAPATIGGDESASENMATLGLRSRTVARRRGKRRRRNGCGRARAGNHRPAGHRRRRAARLGVAAAEGDVANSAAE